MALQALGQSAGGPERVPTGVLLGHLEAPAPHLRELAGWVVGDELAGAVDIDPGTVDADDPLIGMWLWLTLTWLALSSLDPGPERRRWDGMSCAMGRGLPDPAVDLVGHWAARAVGLALAQERAAHRPGARVRILRE
ncbi:hypothetical protein [Streptomyces sp. NRRL F-5135]|uniref:hypothetical protein n=1 Tax=Streptomyces sp. NRRL F-5135 TaxID=1463858 RepID=UPI0004CB81D5|nr:hypothetical protein [Streptomyces sp. NRRL F-5135]